MLLNVSALDRGLGTGGYALVVGPATSEPLKDNLLHDFRQGPGHLVKARYTPMQTMVLGVDEQESPHHQLLQDADDLHGVPVVVADLHSSLPAIIAGARWEAAQRGLMEPSVAYVMTDGGALPAWFSRTVSDLREAGWLRSTITSGQAFGGDLESVTVHTALLAATEVVKADLVIVAQGPGNLGTGTRWGFSGVSAGEAINAAGVLGGRPVATLRVSQADARPRHRGLSHHCLTAYGRVARWPADIAVPTLPAPWDNFGQSVRQQAETLERSPAGHRLVDVIIDPEIDGVLRSTPTPLSTMGRGMDDDPVAFFAAAAAGIHAVRLSAQQGNIAS